MSTARRRSRTPRVPPTRSVGRPRRPPRSFRELKIEHLDGATEFSDDPELQDPVWLIRAVKAHPQLLGPIEQVLRVEPQGDDHPVQERRRRGRPRIPGSWPLVYLAYVISRDPAMESFWQRWQASELWKEAGFPFVPDYDTLRLRFVEMEKLEQERRERGEKTAMRTVADLLIQQARRHESRIGQVVHLDGTGWQTHARLIHDCPDPVRCAAAKTKAPMMIERATDEEVQEHRHQEQAGPEPAEGELPRGAAPEAGEDERFKYIWIGEHRYRTRDKTSGARMHGKGAKGGRRGKKKFWLGGVMVAVVDDLLGAPLSIRNIAADEHEHHAYDGVMNEIAEALGEDPLAATGDRALSVKSVFERNTRRGIASIQPWRQPHPSVTREDMRTEAFDEHGVPRCRHCGGPGDQDSPGLGFYFDARGEPRIRYRCMLVHVDECKKTQSIACSEEWRLLLPIGRLSPLYHTLRKSHEHFERIFRHWRDRYGVAGKNADSRLKRPGVPCQELRTSAALVIEWFRICVRHGWLGSARRREPGELVPVNGDGRLKRLLNARKRSGINLPYGPAAVKLGLARDGPAP